MVKTENCYRKITTVIHRKDFSYLDQNDSNGYRNKVTDLRDLKEKTNGYHGDLNIRGKGEQVCFLFKYVLILLHFLNNFYLSIVGLQCC